MSGGHGSEPGAVASRGAPSIKSVEAAVAVAPGDPTLDDAHAALRSRLREIWRSIESGARSRHTSLVVPSLSFDQEELAKIQGVQFYEERLLFSLIRLRDPRAHVIYVTSQPIHGAIVEYYLGLLSDVRLRDAHRRLALLSVYDTSPRPLTQKILERPRLLRRLRELIGDPRLAYLTCFNATTLEWDLATQLGIPLNGVDPGLAGLGTKTGSRQVFEAASVPCAPGFTGVRSRSELVDALERLTGDGRSLARAVVKLDDSFAGAGNAMYEFPTPLPENPADRRRAIDEALRGLRPTGGEPHEIYLRKLQQMGGIVEEFVEGPAVRSPSVQLRIDPEGAVHVISTHDQVLGGEIGQTYVGCRFPANADYRGLIQGEALKIATVLQERGVIGRFAIDFLVSQQPDGGWRPYAVEINLRMGGTTFPYLALQFLTGGTVDPGTGLYGSARGEPKFYFATDNLRSPAYHGLSPADFMEIVERHDLYFDRASETGAVFHMIGALSQYGRVGVTCIGNSSEQADEIYRGVVEILDLEGELVAGPWSPATHPLGIPISSME